MRVFRQALRDGAIELLDRVRAESYETVLITGSVDLFAEIIARRLSISYWYANSTLLWDENGELVGLSYVKDQAALKCSQLKEFVRSQNITPDACVVVADGENDIETFRLTGKGIAVGSKHEALLKIAWKQVDQLSDVLPIVESM